LRALSSLESLWDKRRFHENASVVLTNRAKAEVARLARTKHRVAVLKELYWEAEERFTGGDLAKAFKIPLVQVSELAGEKRFETSCLLCGASFLIWLPSRSARQALTRETVTANPKWRSCPVCDRDRLKELSRLKKGKGKPLTAGHRAAYQRYLQSPQWKERREKALKKAGGKCSLCSKKGGLDVHHRDYSRIGQERPTDLIAICRGCHSTFHGH